MDSKVTLELPSGCEVVIRKINTDYKKKCCFCGKDISEVKRLILAKDISICNDCVVLSHDILIDEGVVIVDTK